MLVSIVFVTSLLFTPQPERKVPPASAKASGTSVILSSDIPQIIAWAGEGAFYQLHNQGPDSVYVIRAPGEEILLPMHGRMIAGQPSGMGLSLRLAAAGDAVVNADRLGLDCGRGSVTVVLEGAQPEWYLTWGGAPQPYRFVNYGGDPVWLIRVTSTGNRDDKIQVPPGRTVDVTPRDNAAIVAVLIGSRAQVSLMCLAREGR